MASTTLIQVDTGSACGGLEIDKHGVIHEAPPIWRKWKGKSLQKFMGYYGAKLVEITEEVHEVGEEGETQKGEKT